MSLPATSRRYGVADPLRSPGEHDDPIGTSGRRTLLALQGVDEGQKSETHGQRHGRDKGQPGHQRDPEPGPSHAGMLHVVGRAPAHRVYRIKGAYNSLAVEFADHIVLLHRGRVAAAGSPADVMRGAVLESVYEWPLVVTRDPAVGAPSLVPLRSRPRG